MILVIGSTSHTVISHALALALSHSGINFTHRDVDSVNKMAVVERGDLLPIPSFIDYEEKEFIDYHSLSENHEKQPRREFLEKVAEVPVAFLTYIYDIIP